MYKKLLTSLLVLFMFTFIVTPSFSATLNTTEETKIKEVLQQYYDAQYKALSNLQGVSLKDYYDNNNDDLDINQELINTYVEHRKKQVPDLRFTKYSFNLEYKSISINNNNADVQLVESHEIYFNCNPSEPAKMSNCVHQIRLINRNGHWKIQKDDYSDETKEILKQYMKQGKTAKEAKDAIVAASTSDYQKGVKSKDVSNQLVTIAATLNTYYRSNAVSYSDTWALSRNPAWGDYSNVGGDCTNFTSQCLKAGSIPFDTTGTTTSLKWYWYSDSNRVPPWTGASNFNYYAKNNNLSTTSNAGLYAYAASWSNMEIGDIVQLKDSTGTAYHSLFLAAYVRDRYDNVTDYLINCHTTDRYHYPLSSFPQSKDYLKIVGYY